MHAAPRLAIVLPALLAFSCGGQPSSEPGGGARTTDSDGDSSGDLATTSDTSGTGGAQDDANDTEDAASTDGSPIDDGSDESGTGGPPAGHPDGLDPWLVSLDAAQCPLEYPWADAIDDAALSPRTVCPSGCDHTSLTEALAAAQPNDEILLAPGDYDECVTVSVSPLVIRGDNGLARFTAPTCDADEVFKLDGAQVRISSLEISDFEGAAIQFGGQVDQAIIERTWFDGLNFAVRGSPRELMLRKIKVTNSGWYDVPLQHAASIIGTNPDALIIDRSVFSHYRQGAWLLGVHDVPHVEFNCSVIAKVAGLEEEADHSFHVFFPTDFLIRNSYIHEVGRGHHYMYNYKGPAANVVMEGNEFVLDHEQGDFVGNIQPSSIITAVDNVVVGGVGDAALGSFSTGEVSGNTYLPDRAAAGIDPFPALPEHWPIAQL